MGIFNSRRKERESFERRIMTLQAERDSLRKQLAAANRNPLQVKTKRAKNGKHLIELYAADGTRLMGSVPRFSADAASVAAKSIAGKRVIL